MSSIASTLKTLSEWLESDEAKQSYMDWLRTRNEDNYEEVCYTSFINSNPTYMDAKLLLKVNNNGWLNEDFNFNFNITGMCVSITYKYNIYQRSSPNDPRNGESEGMYFYRASYNNNTGEQIYEEKVRIWPDDPIIIMISRPNKNALTGWELVNSFYI